MQLLKKYAGPFACFWLVFLLDQASKIVIDVNCSRDWSQTIIPGFFNLVNWRNTGAAWGMFAQHTWVLGIISLVALVVILFKFSKIAGDSRLAAWMLALLEGGIAGNMVDRVFRRFVIDFLDFHIGDAHWPAFNIADSAICVSICVLAIMSFCQKDAK